MDAIERFGEELTACGLRREVIGMLCDRYGRALRTASTNDWEAFYHQLFAALRAFSKNAGSAAIGGAAMQSVMRILDDDLGHQLFGADAVAAVRASLRNASLVTTSL